MSETLGGRDRHLLRRARRVVGIDEVGRGPLAGPVVVAGVGWSRIPRHPQVRDSKSISSSIRRRVARWIRRESDSWVVVEVWPEVIDEVNILRATRIAMEAVCRHLYGERTIVVVDGVRLDARGDELIVENRADSRYFCVASASILAKVHRDDVMTRLAERYTHWGWERNMGYPTLEHRRALDLHGRSHLHRKSFKWCPVLTCEER